MLTRALLFCGIASSLWYAATNVIVPPLYPGYSVIDLTVSELSAIGSPTRSIWVPLVMPYLVFFALFGWGVIRAAWNRWLIATGWLILFYSAFNLYWPPMHMRAVLAAGDGTVSDTLHLVWAGVTVGLFILIMIVSSIGMERGFRIFSALSLIVLSYFGYLTSVAAPNVAANLPTPYAGLYERINIGVFLLWVVVLAVLLMHRARDEHSNPKGYQIYGTSR